jgi:hypothetical protein
VSDPLIAQLRACCVQVIGKSRGCGFFIAPQRLLTCAHVVGRETPIGAPVAMRRWGESAVSDVPGATLAAIWPKDDVAVLEITDQAPAFAPLEGDARLGQRLVGLGYPKDGEREKFELFEAKYEGPSQFLDQSGRLGLEDRGWRTSSRPLRSSRATAAGRCSIWRPVA